MSERDDGGPVNLLEALANEIERVVQIREQFEGLRGMPNVIVEPQIHMMTVEIDAAKKAIGTGDAVECLKIYQSLKGYD